LFTVKFELPYRNTFPITRTSAWFRSNRTDLADYSTPNCMLACKKKKSVHNPNVPERGIRKEDFKRGTITLT
jgi:hypothetical protein